MRYNETYFNLCNNFNYLCFDSWNQLLKYHVKFYKIRLKTNWMLYKAVDRWRDGKLTVHLVIFIRDKNRCLLINRLSNCLVKRWRTTHQSSWKFTRSWYRSWVMSRSSKVISTCCPRKCRSSWQNGYECRLFIISLENFSIVSATEDVV